MKRIFAHGPTYFANRDSSPLMRSPSGRGRQWLKLGEYLFLVIAALFLGRAALSYGRLRIVQMYEAWQFDHDMPQQAASTGRTAQMPQASLPAPRVEEGQLLGRLEIPRIGISAMVLEGDDDDILAKSAGHVPSTALPGEMGNFVIAAHRDTLFRGLRNIREDDTITFSTTSGTHAYRVESIEKVSPNDVEVLKASATPTLTLVTCYPFNFIGHAPLRFVVKAAEIDATPGIGSEVLTANSAPAGDGANDLTPHLNPLERTAHPRLVASLGPDDEAALQSPSSNANSPDENSSIAAHASLKPGPSPKHGIQAANVASTYSAPPDRSHADSIRTPRKSAANEEAMNKSSQDEDQPPDASMSHRAGKLSKVRAWLGAIPAHFKKRHSEETSADD